MRPLVGTLLAVSLALPAHAGQPPQTRTAITLEYVSPLPGSQYHRPETTIRIRPGGAIDPASTLDDRLVKVRGSVSGDHPGRLSESDDGETLIFEPFDAFTRGETVTWRLGPGLRTKERGRIPPSEFDFTIVDDVNQGALRAAASSVLADELAEMSPGGGAAARQFSGRPEAQRSAAGGADLPGIHRIASGPHSPGYLFLCDLSLTDAGYQSHLLIVDDDGNPVFSRLLPGRALDFKLQPNGWLTYFDQSAAQYYALGPDFAVVDSFRCGNGYTTDLHELQLLPNGHALLMSYDPVGIDMSQVVPGGRTRAAVIGLIVQELDREKRVVFQWRSWDHYQITDATDRDFTSDIIDYAHGNSIEEDDDGNLLVSSRHMDEVTKVDRGTGEIIWRLGGKNNQFTFENDPIGFSHQHDVRRIGNENLTLFDNGFYHTPAFSRAVEYRLDERRRTATLVWEYRPDPPLVAYALGSVQRLDSGNTLIGWGSVEGTTLTEVTPSGETVAGLALDPPLVSYRSFRFDWPPVRGASVAIRPPVITLRSRDPWLGVSIAGDDFDAVDIDVASVRVAGTVAVDPTSIDREPDGHGGSALHIRVERAPLVALLGPGSHRVEVAGVLETGGEFRGYADVRVIGSDGALTGRPRIARLSGAGVLPVEIRVEGGASRIHTISVFGPRGRLVRRWRSVADPQGRIAWDGSRADGIPCASGVYFMRVEDEGTAAALKVVIAR